MDLKRTPARRLRAYCSVSHMGYHIRILAGLANRIPIQYQMEPNKYASLTLLHGARKWHLHARSFGWLISFSRQLLPYSQLWWHCQTFLLCTFSSSSCTTEGCINHARKFKKNYVTVAGLLPVNSTDRNHHSSSTLQYKEVLEQLQATDESNFPFDTHFTVLI